MNTARPVHSGSIPRVLFIVEPYPCRSGGLDFEQPFLYFLRLAYCLTNANLARCSIVASTELLQKYRPCIDKFSPIDAGISPEQPAHWLTEWIEILNGRLPDEWKRFYDCALEQAQPDVIYVWNANEYVRCAAESRRISMVYMEQGYIRTVSGRRYTIDPQNYGPRSRFRELLNTQTLDTQATTPARQWIADHVLSDVFEAAGGLFPVRAQGRARICLLGQKDDDVNNLLYSPFPNQLDYFEQTLDSLSKHAHIDITVRPHPLSNERESLSTLLGKFDVHIDVGHGDIRRAIVENDAFITVNSTAGFEAMLCGKPTMVLGEAGYRAPRDDFARVEDIDAFVGVLQGGAYWTDKAMNRCAQMLALYLRHFSLAQHVASSAAIHFQLIELAAEGSTTWLQRFMEEGSSMASLAHGNLESQLEMEAGFTRYINHMHSTHGSILSAKVAELQVENAIRIDQIAAVESRLNAS